MIAEPSLPDDLPNRWLHLRHPRAFTDLQWDRFKAQCRLFEACARAHLDNWADLGHDYEAPRYVFFPPELSEDRTVASLPLGGDQTLGSRALIENGLSNLLWCYLLSFMPIEQFANLEEGLTEPSVMDPSKLTTNWRRTAEPHRP